jgi:hypothetical protein
MIEDTDKNTKVSLHCSMEHDKRPEKTNVTDLALAVAEAVEDINHKEEF